MDESFPLVEAGGVAVRSDGGALGDFGTIHLLSLIGSPARVRAVVANLWSGKTTALTFPGQDTKTYLRAPEEKGLHRLPPARLPGNLVHTILLPERSDVTRLRSGAFSIIRTAATPAGSLARIHLDYLRRVLDTPLLDPWAEWLLARAQASGELKELTTWGAVVGAWEGTPREKVLEHDLTLALQGDDLYGPLPLPDFPPAPDVIQEVA
jgi:hypothetical protein